MYKNTIIKVTLIFTFKGNFTNEIKSFKIMKGKSVFTPEEAVLIKSALDQCREAGRYSNKDERDTLRKVHKFYISDFDRSREGFTSKDFDHHISLGNIKIKEDPAVTLLYEFVNFDYDSENAKTKFDELTKRVETHAFISQDHKQFVFMLLKEIKKRLRTMMVN